MTEYKLPKNIIGKELITEMSMASIFFDYCIENKVLRDTWSDVASLRWKLGNQLQFNARYKGKPFEELPDSIRSIRIYDIQPYTNFREGEVFNEKYGEILWTAEAFIDGEETYDILNLNLYKGNGLTAPKLTRYPIAVRAKPAQPSKDLLLVKPAVDGLVRKLKESLLQ